MKNIENKYPLKNKTLVIGASTKPERYAYKAVMMLQNHQIETFALGRREGMIGSIKIHTVQEPFEGIDTISLYLRPALQKDILEYIIGLSPRRVIFNPGTENPAFMKELRTKGIETEAACTLVLLQTGQY